VGLIVEQENDGTYSVYVEKNTLLGHITPWYLGDESYWRITGNSEVILFKTIAEAVDWLKGYWEDMDA